MRKAKRVISYEPDEARERDMITNPQKWPRWPLLPVKRRDGAFGAPDGLGFMCDFGRRNVVYLKVVSDFGRLAEIIMTSSNWEAALEAFPQRAFDDLGALLAEYRVD